MFQFKRNELAFPTWSRHSLVHSCPNYGLETNIRYLSEYLPNRSPWLGEIVSSNFPSYDKEPKTQSPVHVYGPLMCVGKLSVRIRRWHYFNIEQRWEYALLDCAITAYILAVIFHKWCILGNRITEFNNRMIWLFIELRVKSCGCETVGCSQANRMGNSQS